MSDLLLKVNYLNLKTNKLLRFPNIIPFDPVAHSFKSNGKKVKEWKHFLIFSIAPILTNSIVIALIAAIMAQYPEVRLSSKQKISLLKYTGIIIPTSCTMSAVLYLYGYDFAVVANWALGTQRKYNFQLSQNWRDGLHTLIWRGKGLLAIFLI